MATFLVEGGSEGSNGGDCLIGGLFDWIIGGLGAGTGYGCVEGGTFGRVPVLESYA